MKKNYCLLLLFLFLGITAQSQTLDDMRNRAKAKFLIDGDTNTDDLVCAQDDATGAWLVSTTSCSSGTISGINYADKTESSWQPMRHLRRLQRMCEDYAANPGGASADLKNGIVKGLEYWYEYEQSHGPVATYCDGNSSYDSPAEDIPWCCDNWFKNYIEKQGHLERIGILFYDYLITNSPMATHDPLMGAQPILDLIINDLPENIDDDDSPDPLAVYEGANKADIAGSIIIRGLLEDNPDRVMDGKIHMECVLTYSPNDEGVQYDWSFFHKDNVLYNGGYGQTYVERTAVFGGILAGPDFGYSQESKNFLFDFVLEGCRWMTIGNNMDYSANGRYLARVYPESNAGLPAYVMDCLIKMAYPNYDISSPSLPPDTYPSAQDLYIMKNHMHSSTPTLQSGVSGNNRFWKSDYLTHHGNGYVSTVKMCSNRNLGTEYDTGDNIKGFWLPYGCTYIYRNGLEYIRPNNNSVYDTDHVNIFPYFDWAKVPGVTSADLGVDGDGKTIVPSLVDASNTDQTQSTIFVGSTGNDNYAVTGMDYDKSYNNSANISANISAKKAWFHFGDEIIALGSNIKSSVDNCHTTILQSLSASDADVTAAATGSTKSIYNDGIAYIFPTEPNVEWTNDTQLGDWTDINVGEDEPVAPNPVFKAWINHGQPETGQEESYFYRIVPNLDASLAPDYNVNNPLTVVNNLNLQWVRKDGINNDGLAGIIYYVAPPSGSFIDISSSLSVRTEESCALLYDESRNEICISSPDRTHSEVNLKINENGTITERKFILPVGEFAGKSRCMDITAPIVSNICNSCGTGGTQFDGGIGTSSSELGLGDRNDECISIAGKVIIDGDFIWNNVTVYLDPGAEIEISDNITFTADNCTFEGCTEMWKGITLPDGGKLIFTGNSISDAQYAIKPGDGSHLEVQDNVFDNNYVGLFVAPSITTGEVITITNDEVFSNNSFTNSSGLKLPFPNQTPAPGSDPLVAIFLNDVSLFDIGMDGATSLINTITDLRNGVFAYNSNVGVYHITITNLIKCINRSIMCHPNRSMMCH